MKKSDTLFRHKANLLYEVGASLREMVGKIINITNNPVIDFAHYADMGVCERVGTWIMDNNGETGVWGLFTRVMRNAGGNGQIYFLAEGDGDYEREGEMYDYTLDELIYLHDELEKIYKFVVKGK